MLVEATPAEVEDVAEPFEAELDKFLSQAPTLTTGEREVIVRQALRLFEDYYVHLALKRSVHGVDPVQRLRILLGARDTFPDTQAFHEELLSIFTSVRDLHTTYKLPKYFHQRAAVLPFRLEEYFEADGTPRVVVSGIEPGWEARAGEHGGAPFERGVVVSTWNGLPVQRAIAANAERQGGCNAAARHARGLATMTDRPLSLSPAPQETSVRLEFVDARGTVGTVTCRWRVIAFASLDATNPSLVKGLGVDAIGEAVRRSQKTRLRPDLVAREPEPRQPSEIAPPAPVAFVADTQYDPPFEPSPVFSDALQYRTFEAGGREVGHLRIRSFGVLNTPGFVSEVRRLLALLPQDGLVLDVRGNGGGVIASGETLLQLFTASHVHPEPMQLRTTDGTRRLSASSREVRAFLPSLTRALETAEVYSDRKPLDSAHERVCNMTGQRYHGPVVLLVDALCYSTTDIFAAGFQDHHIGKVIGVDAATGAGGANVWDYARLRRSSGDADGFEDLPGGTDMRLALRRTLRVKDSEGMPVEEFGIKPDLRHRMTRADVLEGNTDLLAFAAEVLRKQSRPPLGLRVSATATEDGRKQLTITTDGLTRLDAYLAGRPLCASLDIDAAAGTTTTLEITARNTASLQIFGFAGNGGPVAEAAGPIARFLPPGPVAPITPRENEDAMAELPFDGYDKMTEDEVRQRIANELFTAMDSYRGFIKTLLDFEDEQKTHAELIAEYKVEVGLLDDQIDEGTQRWGGTENG